MRHIYLFTENGIAARFGIGKYLQVIIDIIKSSTKYKLTVVSLLHEGFNVKSFTSDGVRYIVVPAVKFGKELYYRNVSYILTRYIDKDSYNIFHYNFMSCYKLVDYLSQIYAKSKSLITMHYSDCDMYNVSTDEMIRTESRLLSICDRIIVLSNYRKNFIVKKYSIPSGKVVFLKHQLPNVYRPSKYSNTVIPDKPYVVFVGRLDENKGIRLLINAFISISKHYRELSLVVVGDGPLLSELLATSMIIRNKIVFTGYMCSDDIAHIYKNAILGVIPSRYEEYGLVASEMRAAGLYILSNKNWGLLTSLQGYEKVDFVDLNCVNSVDKKVELLSNALMRVLKKLPAGNYQNVPRETKSSQLDFIKFADKMVEIYATI